MLNEMRTKEAVRDIYDYVTDENLHRKGLIHVNKERLSEVAGITIVEFKSLVKAGYLKYVRTQEGADSITWRSYFIYPYFQGYLLTDKGHALAVND